MAGRQLAEAVNPVDFPEELDYLWSWFISLHNGRQQAMVGIAPITESDIGWFFFNRRIGQEGWEADAIKMIDKAVAAVLSADDK